MTYRSVNASDSPIHADRSTRAASPRGNPRAACTASLAALTLPFAWAASQAQTPTCAPDPLSPPGCNPVASDQYENVLAGTGVLQSTTNAANNTAIGHYAMNRSVNGYDNVAIGYYSMSQGLTTGYYNVAVGDQALLQNSSGNHNTAIGGLSMYMNTTAGENTAVGYLSLYSNKTGTDNTALGFQAMNRSTAGFHNSAGGYDALFSNKGNYNTGFGSYALYANASGVGNIALGYKAGYAVTGSNNIDIGAQGVGGDSGVTRIGDPASQSKVYIAGITSAHLTGSPVYVGADGQLGVLASSERYKTEIASMGDNSDKLQALRPVTYKLKRDPKAGTQYGLVAEEVAQVYPDLVIRDAQGTIQGVRYDELAPLLLNELQKQHAQLQSQHAELARLKAQNDAVLSALARLQPTDPPLARR